MGNFFDGLARATSPAYALGRSGLFRNFNGGQSRDDLTAARDQSRWRQEMAKATLPAAVIQGISAWP